ncbi:hypothetical protein HYZ99_03385 [Candidatus Peregrinibacteria bacterium]|nr:hypothetical protein [Candidatus Peregrinibacteria bacterium]
MSDDAEAWLAPLSKALAEAAGIPEDPDGDFFDAMSTLYEKNGENEVNRLVENAMSKIPPRLQSEARARLRFFMDFGI